MLKDSLAEKCESEKESITADALEKNEADA